MTQSHVQDAYDAFFQQNYALALERFRQAGLKLGNSLFEANIEICRKRYHLQQAESSKEAIKKKPPMPTKKKNKIC